MAFPSTGILDNFNRGNEGPPMTGWTAFISVGLEVLSNQCAPDDTTDNGGQWTAAMGQPDVEVYITIATLPVAGGETVLFARHDPAGGGTSGNNYNVSHLVGTPDVIRLRRADAGVHTTIGGPWNQDLSAGDTLGLTCVGSTISAWAIISGVETLMGEATDATHSGSSPKNKLSIYNFGNSGATARYDNFGGGLVWAGGSDSDVVRSAVTAVGRW